MPTTLERMPEEIGSSVSKNSNFASPWKQAMEGGLYLALVTGVLLFGGGFVEGYTFLETSACLLLSALALYSAFYRPVSFVRSVIHPEFIILSLWLAFLCIQLAGLPFWMVRSLSPHTIQLWQKFSFPGTDLSRLSLSLVPHEGQVALGKTLAYAALFFISYHLMHEKQSLRRLGMAVIAMGVFVSLLGLVCFRLNPTKIYGVYGFEQSSPFTPYLNKNHFANFLVMSLPVNLGFICYLVTRSSLSTKRGLRSKILWFAGREATGLLVMLGLFAVQLAAFFYPASRGGLIGLFFAFAGFIWFLTRRFKNNAAAFIFAAAILILLVFGIFQAKPLLAKLKLLSGLRSEDIAFQFRLSNWQDTFKMFLDFPAAGIGAGAFYQLFPLFKSIPEISTVSQVRFYHAENELLEALAEQGVIGTGLLLWMGGVLWFRFVKNWDRMESKTVRWLSLGIASACIGMLGHSFFDFTLHVPANMALFAVLGGALARLTAQEENLAVPNGELRSWVRFFSVFPTFLIVLFLLSTTGPFLIQQWKSESNYRKGKETLNQMYREKEISSPPLLSSYEFFLKAKKAGAHSGKINNGLGQIYSSFGLLAGENTKKRQGWFRQAEASFIEAIRSEPFDAEHHYRLGWLYTQWKKEELAAPYLAEAASLEPKNPFYQFQAGYNQLKLKRLAEARLQFQKAIQNNMAYIEPVLTLLIQSDPPTSLEEIHELLPFDQNHEEIKQRFASFFDTKQNDHQTAETIRHFS